MGKHQKESEFQNFILILMIIIVLFIIIAFGYYYIKEQQNQNTNNIDNTTLNNVSENTIIEDNEQTAQNTISDTEENVEETEENDEGIQELIVTKTISPRGFAGASNYNLCLYSDKTVYLITYNGEGYTEKDISSKQLLAENVEDIYYDENVETMYIVGGTKVSDGGVNWIEFK